MAFLFSDSTWILYLNWGNFQRKVGASSHEIAGKFHQPPALPENSATDGFPMKWCLRNKHRNSILMMCHYPDLSSVSDWWCRMENLLQPIRSTNQMWHLNSVEFLHLFLRHHSTGRPVVASQNIGCFLTLIINN